MKPYRFNEVLTGLGADVIEVSPQYQRTMITITGNQVGTVTIRPKQELSIHFEEMVNSTIDLRYNKTMIIDGVQLKALEFTITPPAAYNVEIKQYDPQE